MQAENSNRLWRKQTKIQNKINLNDVAFLISLIVIKMNNKTPLTIRFRRYACHWENVPTRQKVASIIFHIIFKFSLSFLFLFCEFKFSYGIDFMNICKLQYCQKIKLKNNYNMVLFKQLVEVQDFWVQKFAHTITFDFF